MDLNGAVIAGDSEWGPPISLPNLSSNTLLFALDIGGTLAKLVYFEKGQLNFVKFENGRIHECLDFIQSKKLNCGISTDSLSTNVMINATGGGAFKFANAIEEKLGVPLNKLDELGCSVSGANFLLQNINHESFTHINGKKTPIQIYQDFLFPYLLVNIGSGVGMTKVTGNKKYELVTGTHISSNTMFGLAKLLTGCMRYDEFVKLSEKGNNLMPDLILKDINGEVLCLKEDLSRTIADSGKVINAEEKLSDYRPEDLAMTLLFAFTCNIAQIVFLLASSLGINKVVFAGSFIQSHARGVDIISNSIAYWSKGQMQSVFLRHEGFPGALGAFISYNSSDDSIHEDPKEQVNTVLQNGSTMVRVKPTTEHTEDSMFPYLVVNIGSGVSMMKLIGKGNIEGLTSTYLNGCFILWLARLLTGCTSFQEFSELSQRGDCLSVNLSLGDIYDFGGDKAGALALAVASSFGKITSNKLSDYRAEDLAAGLLNVFTSNIGQISHIMAHLHGLKRIHYQGKYICGHAKTMEKISHPIYWPRGLVQTFICCEGLTGADSAFSSFENMGIDGLEILESMKQLLLSATYMFTKGQHCTEIEH